jgi:type IX secretion system PorP/SprF family membrane protein
MRKLLSLFLFSVLCTAVRAQDPNFSQFFASPLTLNPALTGKFNGDVRVAGNYRNQWPTINKAFTTYTVSADFGILKNNISEVDQFGVGVLGFSDQSGNGILQYNYLGLSTAYHKGLDEDGYNQLGAGFQTTYVSKRLDISALKFPDMLRSDGFTGVTQEDFAATKLSVSYLDVNAGLLYTGTSNGLNNYYAGVSMYHINRPKETFKDGIYLLPTRLTIQAGGMVPINGGSDAIHISANYSRHANATNTVFG